MRNPGTDGNLNIMIINTFDNNMMVDPPENGLKQVNKKKHNLGPKHLNLF